MNASLKNFETRADIDTAAERLDRYIRQAATQLIGKCDGHDDPLVRFVLLCTARAQFENDGVVGVEPELQWVPVARDALVEAANSKADDGHYPLPYLLSESPPAIDSQRELFHAMAGGLVIANTDESPDAHWDIDFAAQVADDKIQIRYT